MSFLSVKALAVFSGLAKHGAPATLTGAPGPILAFIEQLLAQLLPMLTQCIPAVAASDPNAEELLTGLHSVAAPGGAGYRIAMAMAIRREIRQSGEPTLYPLVQPIKDSIAEQCGLCTATDSATALQTVAALAA